MFDNWLPTLGISVLIMFVLYRRARRLFGRQRYDALRLGLRVVLFATLGGMLFLVVSMVRGLAPWIGLAAGITLGLLGVYLTRFESVDGELYYEPNPYLGIAMLSLLVGRLVYRLAAAGGPADGIESTSAGAPSFANLPGNPLTSAILFVVLGYFSCYYGAVLIRGQTGGR